MPDSDTGHSSWACQRELHPKIKWQTMATGRNGDVVVDLSYGESSPMGAILPRQYLARNIGTTISCGTVGEEGLLISKKLRTSLQLHQRSICHILCLKMVCMLQKLTRYSIWRLYWDLKRENEWSLWSWSLHVTNLGRNWCGRHSPELMKRTAHDDLAQPSLSHSWCRLWACCGIRCVSCTASFAEYL